MENVAEFSELPLFNNLKIANLCNKGLCPEKVESIINDVDILPTLDGNMAKQMDSLLSMIDLLLSLNALVIGRVIYTHFYLDVLHSINIIMLEIHLTYMLTC